MPRLSTRAARRFTTCGSDTSRREAPEFLLRWSLQLDGKPWEGFLRVWSSEFSKAELLRETRFGIPSQGFPTATATVGWERGSAGRRSRNVGRAHLTDASKVSGLRVRERVIMKR